MFNVTVPVLLQFLTHYFEKGSSYGTLNSYRSAVAFLSTSDVTSDVRVRRFFKGVFSVRPSLPKYSSTWDPVIVLNYIRNKSSNSMSLENLTLKLAGLLALATGQRVQTLSKIELQNIKKNAEGITIKISERIKTSGCNRLQPLITLPFFKQDPRVCVAKTLLNYLESTMELRGPTSKYLFITFKKPHHQASPQTISRWIKVLLGRSGLDVSTFTAHSARHAATSAAARKGVNIDTIKRSAGWTEKSKVFANFYHRPLTTPNNFVEAVLDS